MHGINYQHQYWSIKPIRGDQNYNTNQILILDVYVKVGETLYTQVIILANTILNRIDTKMMLPTYSKVFA